MKCASDLPENPTSVHSLACLCLLFIQGIFTGGRVQALAWLMDPAASRTGSPWKVLNYNLNDSPISFRPMTSFYQASNFTKATKATASIGPGLGLGAPLKDSHRLWFSNVSTLYRHDSALHNGDTAFPLQVQNLRPGFYSTFLCWSLIGSGFIKYAPKWAFRKTG